MELLGARMLLLLFLSLSLKEGVLAPGCELLRNKAFNARLFECHLLLRIVVFFLNVDKFSENLFVVDHLALGQSLKGQRDKNMQY